MTLQTRQRAERLEPPGRTPAQRQLCAGPSFRRVDLFAATPPFYDVGATDLLEQLPRCMLGPCADEQGI
jgi:hypothetical protein